MKTKERIFHSVLFELIALSLFTMAAVFVTGNGALEMSGLAISLSLLAMSWNYIYNLVFDRIFGMDRAKRTLLMRIGHGAGFEVGMVVFSFPIMMWMLQQSFLAVAMMSIGASLFFFLYAIAYNWVYDLIRARIVSQRATGELERATPTELC